MLGLCSFDVSEDATLGKADFEKGFSGDVGPLELQSEMLGCVPRFSEARHGGI